MAAARAPTLALALVAASLAAAASTVMRREAKEPRASPVLPLVPPSLSKEQQGCSYCCMDGANYGACADVVACAERGPAQGRYAFVLALDGYAGSNFLPHLGAMRARAKASAPHNIDIVLLLHGTLSDEVRERLVKQDVIIKAVDWAVPPGMLFTRPENWCGPKDLVRLHALALTEYDAVAYYDADVQLQGDVLPLLRCAATGPLLTTNGGVGEPLNVGFFAARPDKRLVTAAIAFARRANYSDKGGWAGSGFSPAGGYYVGMECGQGFFHTLFYMRDSAAAREALHEAKLDQPGQFVAAQIDRCVWNYQTSYQCRENFDCSLVRAHHKPALVRQGSEPRECQKMQLAEV